MALSELATSLRVRSPESRRYIAGWLWALGALPVLFALTALFTRVLPDALAPVAEASAHAPSQPLETTLAWQQLRVGQAVTPEPRYTAPLPARVVADERRSARVGSPLAGRVEAVYVELGQRVQRGAALFRVASPSLPDLHRDLALAEVELASAQREDARVQSMVRERLLPAKEALASSARLRQAELSRRTAAARLEALRVASRGEHSFVVRAPLSGTVVGKDLAAAQSVTPGVSLLHIADLSGGVFVIADVFEDDVEGLQVGAPARIEWPAGGAEPATAATRIEMIAGVVDPERRTVAVRMHVQDERLRVHQQLRVRLLRSWPEGVVEVPNSAVLSDGIRAAVYVVSAEGRYERRDVQAGMPHAGRIAVSRGLALGERVVEAGAFLLDSRPHELF